MADILLSLGGNLGEPVRTMRAALEALGRAGVTITARSRFYATPPWGRADQPDFVNCCAAGRTSLAPQALLPAIQRIETDLGRERSLQWGPRLIDIDLLTYDDVMLNEPGLTLPHRHLTERAFVLVPLAEIAGPRVIAGQTVADWATACDRRGIVALPEPAATEPSLASIAPPVQEDR